MGVIELIIYVLIIAGLAYLIFKNNSEGSSSEVDQLKTQQFIDSAADAAAEAASKSVKKELGLFKTYKIRIINFIKKKLVKH